MIDNKNGGLDNKIGVEALKSYADIIYHLFELYDDMVEIFGINLAELKETV